MGDRLLALGAVVGVCLLVPWPALGEQVEADLGPPAVDGREASGLPLFTTARLRLASRDVPRRIEEAVSIAESLGGRLESRDVLSVVVVVPVERRAEALARVEALGDVLERRVAAREGDTRLRDLTVRRRSATEMLSHLQHLARRARGASDALAVQREIERVSREVAEIDVERARLSSRVRLLLVSVSFTPIAPESHVPRQRFALPIPWLERLGLPTLLAGAGFP